MRFCLFTLTRLHSPSLALGLVVASAVAGCGRSGLDALDDPYLLGYPSDGGDDAVAADAGLEAAPLQEGAAPPATSSTTAPTDPCANMPPIPCAGGGYEYCVAGHYSQCPKRCAACVPGSTRVCFITYCKAWGAQTCAADGLSFGVCEESSPPDQCAPAADGDKATPALEQCCIDSGHCCQDLFDLNGNGDTSDMVGNCSGTTC